MKTIWKFQLPFMEVATVKMPVGAEVIRVAGLDGFLWLWAIVDNAAQTEDRVFYLIKTGAKFPDNKPVRYLGCGAIFIQMELMMYVFEESK